MPEVARGRGALSRRANQARGRAGFTTVIRYNEKTCKDRRKMLACRMDEDLDFWALL